MLFFCQNWQALEDKWLIIVRDVLKSVDASDLCLGFCRQEFGCLQVAPGAGPQARFVLQIPQEQGHGFGWADPKVPH